MRRMIVLGAVALGVASFALPASAQEYAPPIPFRLLSDPAYLPMQGQWYGSSSFSLAQGGSDEYDSTGAKIVTHRHWDDEISQELEYGITDEFALDVADTYDPFDKHKDEAAGGGFSDNDKSGFHDPSVGVTWRVIDQASHQPVSLDLLANYTANLIAAQTTNVAEGGQSGEFGAAVSKVMPGSTIYGKLAADWYGDQSQFNPANGNFIREQSYWDYLVDLETQTRLSDLFSINAGAGYIFANNARVMNLTSGIDHMAEPGDGLKLDAALNYLIVPYPVVVSLTYDYRRDDGGQKIFALPVDDTTTRNRDNNTVGVRFVYDTP
ncbi:MAG TPA: hypothetical protein VGG36_01515 [Rhizomicrobium sp.]